MRKIQTWDNLYEEHKSNHHFIKYKCSCTTIPRPPVALYSIFNFRTSIYVGSVSRLSLSGIFSFSQEVARSV
jgi:hypothetical protein